MLGRLPTELRYLSQQFSSLRAALLQMLGVGSFGVLGFEVEGLGFRV